MVAAAFSAGALDDAPASPAFPEEGNIVSELGGNLVHEPASSAAQVPSAMPSWAWGLFGDVAIEACIGRTRTRDCSPACATLTGVGRRCGYY
jgi:hypothetical protein